MTGGGGGELVVMSQSLQFLASFHIYVSMFLHAKMWHISHIHDQPIYAAKLMNCRNTFVGYSSPFSIVTDYNEWHKSKTKIFSK